MDKDDEILAADYMLSLFVCVFIFFFFFFFFHCQRQSWVSVHCL